MGSHCIISSVHLDLAKDFSHNLLLTWLVTLQKSPDLSENNFLLCKKERVHLNDLKCMYSVISIISLWGYSKHMRSLLKSKRKKNSKCWHDRKTCLCYFPKSEMQYLSCLTCWQSFKDLDKRDCVPSMALQTKWYQRLSRVKSLSR